MNEVWATFQSAAPDGWVEGATSIILAIISWYLGRRRGAIKERDKRRMG